MFPALLTLALLAALLSLALRRPRPDFSPLVERERRVAWKIRAQERSRRYLQICRGILRRENGLEVEVVPRPGRANTSSRVRRRALMRRARAAIQPR